MSRLVAIVALIVLGDSTIAVPCSDVPPAPTFVGPPLPVCKPTDDMLKELEMLRTLDLLESWEVLGE